MAALANCVPWLEIAKEQANVKTRCMIESMKRTGRLPSLAGRSGSGFGRRVDSFGQIFRDGLGNWRAGGSVLQNGAGSGLDGLGEARREDATK